MEAYMKSMLIVTFFSLVIGSAAAQAPVPATPLGPNAEVTNKAVDLTAEQDAAIYRDATMTPAERAQIPIRLGDTAPLTAKTFAVPESLGVEKTKGLSYTVVPNLHDGHTYHDVILVDANRKVVRIIPGQRPFSLQAPSR
jgi:hypothetical protein